MTTFDHILSSFDPISLDDMKSVRLMNRIDTKYVATVDHVLEVLKESEDKYYVQIIDGNGNLPYRTVYYDTSECGMYLAHLHGRLTRQKVRERFYDSSGIGFLEIKQKNNKGRTKKKRVPFDVPEEERRSFIDENSSVAYGSLTPVVENAFNRITLVNKEMTERITIDTSLGFRHLATGNTKSLDGIAIIELKRDGLARSEMASLLRKSRIHPMGFSKYCMGMAFTDPSLPVNRFKPRLRKIEKMLASLKEQNKTFT